MSEIINFSKITFGSCKFIQIKLYLQNCKHKILSLLKGNLIRSGSNLKEKKTNNNALYVFFAIYKYKSLANRYFVHEIEYNPLCNFNFCLGSQHPERALHKE